MAYAEWKGWLEELFMQKTIDRAEFMRRLAHDFDSDMSDEDYLTFLGREAEIENA